MMYATVIGCYLTVFRLFRGDNRIYRQKRFTPKYDNSDQIVKLPKYLQYGLLIFNLLNFELRKITVKFDEIKRGLSILKLVYGKSIAYRTVQNFKLELLNKEFLVKQNMKLYWFEKRFNVHREIIILGFTLEFWHLIMMVTCMAKQPWLKVS